MTRNNEFFEKMCEANENRYIAKSYANREEMQEKLRKHDRIYYKK